MKRSFNILAKVGSQNDMNSNHMLAIIEQKMFSDDRKVWSHFLESTKSEATEMLISWITSEMKSRMRTTALSEVVTSPSKASVMSVMAMEKRQQTTSAGYVKFQLTGQINAQNSWQ